MASSGIDIKFNHLAQIAAKLHNDAIAETAKAAHALEAQEKQKVIQDDAVDTGFMVNSIQAQQVDKFNWIVGNGAEYSPHVNYGTIHQPARNFVEYSVAIIGPQYIAAMNRLVEKSR